MGTYVANFALSTIQNQTGGPIVFIAINSAYYQTTIGNNTSNQFIVTYLGNTISLDGAAAVPFASIPSGFHISNAGRFHAQDDGQILLGGYRMVNAGFGIQPYLNLGILFEHSSYNSRQSVIPTNSSDNGLYDVVDFGAINPTGGYKWIDLNLFVRITSSLTLGRDIGEGQYTVDLAYPAAPVITGSYDIISTHWLLDNLTNPDADYFKPGDQGKLHNDTDTPDIFDEVTEINLGDTPVTDFDEQDDTHITFTLPPLPDDPTTPVTIECPTQFTGDAVVDVIRVLNPNRSGIYTITSDLRHDTIYLGDGTNDTENKMIPNPFIKTGFIGG